MKSLDLHDGVDVRELDQFLDFNVGPPVDEAITGESFVKLGLQSVPDSAIGNEIANESGESCGGGI